MTFVKQFCPVKGQGAVALHQYAIPHRANRQTQAFPHAWNAPSRAFPPSKQAVSKMRRALGDTEPPAHKADRETRYQTGPRHARTLPEPFHRSASMTRNPSVTTQRFHVLANDGASLRDRSTKYTNCAPRLMASMPTAAHAGITIEECRAFDARSEHIEQRFTQLVAGRTDAWRRVAFEPAAAKGSGDHAHHFKSTGASTISVLAHEAFPGSAQ